MTLDIAKLKAESLMAVKMPGSSPLIGVVLELIAALEAAEEMVELQRFKLERQAEDLHQAKSLESIHREKRYEVEREFNSYKYETDRNVHRLASEVTRLEDALELAGINLETGGE